MKKKIIAVVLAALMMLATLPGVMAEEADANIVTEDETIIVENSDGEAEVIPENTENTEETSIMLPIVDFTNVAPMIKNGVTTTTNVPVVSTLLTDAPSLPSRASLLRSSVMARIAPPAGLYMGKGVASNADGSEHTVTLEVYTTGTVTVQTVTKPMDIVLVLDQSGSMADCIVCGETVGDNSTHELETYTEVYVVQDDGTYYIKNGNSYSRVYYCDGEEWYGSYHQAGWYTERHGRSHNGRRLTYKVSDDSAGEQFYTVEVTGSEDCETRLSALTTAVQNFVDEVYKKAAGADGIHGNDDDVAHRIAIVGFASQYYYGYNTELLSISGTNSGTVGIAYNSITTDNYRNVLQNLGGNNHEAGKNMLDSAIDALAANGATQSNLGMEMAVNIFENNTVNVADRDRVTIMFTDGTPTTESRFSETVANSAIGYARTLKQTYNSTVYTVGVFSGADATLSLPENNTTGSNRENRYMQLVSSNYLTASNMNNPGSRNPAVTGNNSYYLSASNAAALNDIFQSMSSQIGGSTINLGTETIIKDIVTPQFDMPEGVDSVTVKQVDCTGYVDGKPTWGTEETLDSTETVTIDEETNSVSVTGFDFNRNFVASNGRVEGDSTSSGDFYGRKLVITFNVTPDPDFLGGDDVITNGEDSGIYADGNCLGTFVQPTVDIKVKKVENVAKDKNIYYSNTTDLTGILDLKVSASDSGKDLKALADGINNAYVNIVYDVTFTDGTVATYTIEAGEKWNEGTWTNANDEVLTGMDAVQINSDTVYGIECTVTSKNNAENFTTARKDSHIYVYNPELTFKDIDGKTPLTDKVNYATDNYVSEVWKHGATVSTEVTMEGSKPELTLEYTPDADCVDDNGVIQSLDDFYVNVKVQTGGKDLTNVTTFVHQECETADCSFDSTKGKFMIHVIELKVPLTITKVINGDMYSKSDSFIFTVEGTGRTENVEMTVVINGFDEIIGEDGKVTGYTKAVTIKDLPIGEYTVTEDTNWSWRYQVKGDNAQTIALVANPSNDQNKVTITNKISQKQWLSGESSAENQFTVNGTAQNN